MQVKTESFDAVQHTNEETSLQINPEDIAGYIIQRSPTSNFLFNAYAVSQDDELLFCAASDLSFEKATALVEAINQEHYPYVPSPTEQAYEQINKR